MRKPTFVEPFIIACHTRHAKLAGIGVICLQRLVASRALPAHRLKDILAGLRETTSLSKPSWPEHGIPLQKRALLTVHRSGYSTEDLAIVAVSTTVLL